MSIVSVNECDPDLTWVKFDNPRVTTIHAYDGTPPKSWRIQDEARMRHFPADEWEMKVEFKRKLSVGDKVTAPMTVGTGVIDAISKTSGSPEYWVRGVLGSHMTYIAAALKRVSDDN